MHKFCSQCDFPFTESPIQFHRRIKTNGPTICQQCYRINHAEERKALRDKEKEPKNNYEDSLIEKVLDFKKKYGKVSQSFLIRKFKMEPKEALEMCLKVEGMN